MALDNQIIAAMQRIAAQFKALPPPGEIAVRTGSMPANPTAGRQVIRADLSYELFVFDPARNAWLTPSRRVLVFGGENELAILSIGSVSQNDLARDGFYFPYDARITRWATGTRFPESGSLQLFINGTTVAQQPFAAQATYGSGEALDIPVAAGSRVTMQIVNSTSGGWTRTVSTIEYARKAS